MTRLPIPSQKTVIVRVTLPLSADRYNHPFLFSMGFTLKKAICFIEQMSGKIDLHDKSNKALLYYLEMNERKDIFIHVGRIDVPELHAMDRLAKVSFTFHDSPVVLSC